MYFALIEILIPKIFSTSSDSVKNSMFPQFSKNTNTQRYRGFEQTNLIFVVEKDDTNQMYYSTFTNKNNRKRK